MTRYLAVPQRTQSAAVPRMTASICKYLSLFRQFFQILNFFSSATLGRGTLMHTMLNQQKHHEKPSGNKA